MGPPPTLTTLPSLKIKHIQILSTIVFKLLLAFPSVLIFDSKYIQILNQKTKLFAKIPTLSQSLGRWEKFYIIHLKYQINVLSFKACAQSFGFFKKYKLYQTDTKLEQNELIVQNQRMLR